MKRAFSLVELLVVVAIIVILAAILFPVFARVRENGRRSACQSNLKQIGMGLIQYSQDYDEILVADWYGSTPSVGPYATQPLSAYPRVSYKWEDAAFPYVKNEQVFNCPSATGDAAVPYHYYKTLTAPQPDTQLGSYIIMHGYGPDVAGKTPPVSHPAYYIDPNTHVVSRQLVSLSQAVVPSTTAWVLDGNGEFYCEVDTGTNTLPPDLIAPRHLETIGVLFLDGHVKSIKESVLNTPNANGVLPMVTLQDD